MICLHAFRMPAREDEEAFFSDPRNQRICYTAKRALSCIPLLPSAAAPTSHSPRGPDHHQRRCLRPPAGHPLHQRRHRRRPGPASGRRWTMCGSAGRSFGSGRQTSAPPENAPQSGRKVFWTAGQRNFFWRWALKGALPGGGADPAAACPSSGQSGALEQLAPMQAGAFFRLLRLLPLCDRRGIKPSPLPAIR